MDDQGGVGRSPAETGGQVAAAFALDPVVTATVTQSARATAATGRSRPRVPANPPFVGSLSASMEHGYTGPMNAVRSPLAYEFETAEAEASYNEWLQAKVAASLADPRPPIPHDEVERRMAERIAALKAKHATR